MLLRDAAHVDVEPHLQSGIVHERPRVTLCLDLDRVGQSGVGQCERGSVRLRCGMDIGEKNLAFVRKGEFGRPGLLDLDHHGDPYFHAGILACLRRLRQPMEEAMSSAV